MDKSYKKYLKLIGAAVALTGVISLFSAAGIVFNLNDNGIIVCQIMAFLICGVASVLYMKKKEPTLQAFGFQKPPLNKRMLLFMTVIVLIQPGLFGVNHQLPLSTMALIMVQMLLVGFVEETVFRGIFLYVLRDQSPKVFLLFSSLVFGVLHMASSLNPETAGILVGLQIINALLLGLVFSLIYYTQRSIYTVILFHGSFNVLATLSNAGSIGKNITAVLLLSLCYGVFLLYFSRGIAPIANLKSSH